MDDEQNVGSVTASLRRSAVDPAIAECDRRPPTPPGSVKRLAARVSGAVNVVATAVFVAAVGAAIPWAIGVLVFLGSTRWQSSLARWALVVAAAVALVTVVVRFASFIWFIRFGTWGASEVGARTHGDGCLTASDFDARSSALLGRAQDAIDAVRSSDVCQAGLLDAGACGAALAAQEWEIALALREQTELREARALLPAIAEDSPARELLDRQHECADLADQSVAARVTSLEELAAEVRRADNGYRDWQAYAAVSELADRHLDMLARTAADSLAIAEIAAMSQQARVVHSALREMRAG
jgi:hypothetical protein